MTSKTLTLVLNDAVPVFAQPMLQTDWPESLKKLVKYARFQPDQSGQTAQLIDLFSHEKTANTDVAAAALRDADMCIDPCYLHADRDKLLLFHQDINISTDEAEALIALIQPLLSHWGEIKQHSPTQWSLSLVSPTQVQFAAMDRLHGLPVTDALPKGDDSVAWIKVWNEIQMVLFDCEINQAREQRGELPINGVWFWGQGALPELHAWSHISGDINDIAVLVERSASTYQPAAGLAEVAAYPAIHCHKDISALNQWSDVWLQPAIHKLKYLQLHRLLLVVPGWGTYRLNSWQAWRCR